MSPTGISPEMSLGRTDPAPPPVGARKRRIPPPAPWGPGQRALRWAAGLSALALAVLLAWLFSFLLLPFALAFIGYYVVSSWVQGMELRGVPRGGAVLLAFSGLLIGVVAVAVLVWPSLTAWIEEGATDSSRYEVQLERRIEAWHAYGSARWPQLPWESLMERARAGLAAQKRSLTETLPSLILGALSSVGTLLLTPFILLFLLLDGPRAHRRLVRMLPNRHFETGLVLIHRVDRQIAAYLRGTATESVIVATLLSAMLLAVGMPNAVLLGCIGGLANVIPIAGPVLGTAAGMLYALMDPAAPALAWPLIGYVSVYGLDATVINPMVMGKSVDLHPLAVLVGLSVGGAFGGILGMLVCIPLMAVGKAVVATLIEAHRKGQIGWLED